MPTNERPLFKLGLEIDGWVERYLAGFDPRKIKGNKIIKDPVWGMITLSPLEISLLDCPLVQRLRRIHQTGLTFLTYPSALHTRFDHTLGMLHCATKIVSTINEKYFQMGDITPFSPKDIQEIRLASILHDTGHACLSHLTEPFFDDYWLIEHSIKEIEESYKVKPKSHELITFLIIKSPFFKEFFKTCVRENHPGDIRDPDASLNRIADMVIGRSINGDSKEAYKTEVINGPYDADKLDYIFRDSYFTGISLSTDIDRFIFGLSIGVPPETQKNSIVLDVNAASSYEQLMFSKISLYVNVYNHQKILATNQMLETILAKMKSLPGIKIKDISLTNPINFLSLTDWDFLTGDSTDQNIKDMQKKIERRELYVRLFRISTRTAANDVLSPKCLKVIEDKNSKEQLRQKICRGLGINSEGINTIKIGFPDNIEFKELVDAYVRHFDNNIVPFSAVFPLEWIETYNTNKWVGYIYGFHNYASYNIYNKIKDILNKELAMEFNENSAPKFH